jgi:isopenicillin N synthase-like dioxygenase
MGPVSDIEFPNIWPQEIAIPGFKSWIEYYFGKTQQLAMQLMRILEVAMDLPAGALTARCEDDASELRLNHYPSTPVSKLRDGNSKRIWPHTDFGIITLLAQDSEGGLEIEHRGQPGGFVPVPLIKKTELVVNVGDTLERWTNGILKAGLHQVSLPCGVQDGILPTRYSAAFFLKANRMASVGPIGLLVPYGCEPEYEDMTAIEYQKRRTAVVY